MVTRTKLKWAGHVAWMRYAITHSRFWQGNRFEYQEVNGRVIGYCIRMDHRGKRLWGWEIHGSGPGSYPVVLTFSADFIDRKVVKQRTLKIPPVFLRLALTMTILFGKSGARFYLRSFRKQRRMLLRNTVIRKVKDWFNLLLVHTFDRDGQTTARGPQFSSVRGDVQILITWPFMNFYFIIHKYKAILKAKIHVLWIDILKEIKVFCP
jgi:hypothetical protein